MNKSQLPSAEEWHQVIDGQRPSGLTVAAYCRDRGIKDGAFYAWKRRLRSPRKRHRSSAPVFVEVDLELDAGQRDRSVNVAPAIAIGRPKPAVNAPEGATTRAIEAGKTLYAACADVRMHKIADDRRWKKPNWSPTGKSRIMDAVAFRRTCGVGHIYRGRLQP